MRISIAAAVLMLAACGGQDKAGNAAANSGAGNPAPPAVRPTRLTGTSYQPGQWEVTERYVWRRPPYVPPPGGQAGPRSSTASFCMTAAAARRRNTRTEGGCTADFYWMSDGHMTATLECRDGERATLSGTFTATSYDYTTRGHRIQDGVPTDFENRTTGRRVGACTGHEEMTYNFTG